jgi:hypothetical protein
MRFGFPEFITFCQLAFKLLHSVRIVEDSLDQLGSRLRRFNPWGPASAASLLTSARPRTILTPSTPNCLPRSWWDRGHDKADPKRQGR